MVNSSPEYSITKPGLHRLRKREKPLRTYGRQPSTPEAQGEPPLKRQRLSARGQQKGRQEEKLSSTPDSPNDAPEPAATPTAAPSSETRTTRDAPNQTKADDAKRATSAKGSILSYFKPAPAPPKPKDETQSRPEDEPSAPPASPPKQKQPSRRKPRLLKIKAVTHKPLDEPSKDPDGPLHKSHETTPHTLTQASEPEAPPDSASPRKASSRNHHHQKPSPKRRPKPSASVQTTLNISAKAAFSECKVCDTVWNPLYPDDVKFHNKAHKAVLRAQRKRTMDEL